MPDETAQSDIFMCCLMDESYFLDYYYYIIILAVGIVGETGVSWHMGFVGILSFSLSANYDFTKEYHLYKGTNNTHTPYRFQSCSTNTVGMNQLCLNLQSKYFSFQKSSILPPMIVDYDD